MLHLGLGQFEEARKELASVAATYREDLPREHPLVAVKIIESAQGRVAARALGDATKGQALAEQALAIGRKDVGARASRPRPPCWRRWPLATAIRGVRQGRDHGHPRQGLIGKCCGGGHFFLAAAWDAQRPTAQIEAGHFDEAAALCAQAEKVSLATLGRNHPEYAAEQYTRARWAIAHGQPHGRHLLNRTAKSPRSRKTSPP